MSRAALCVLVLAGCNQVFGLDSTVSLDAPPGLDAPDVGTGSVLLRRVQVDVSGPGPAAPLPPMMPPITNARLRAHILSGELAGERLELGLDPDNAMAYLVPRVVLENPSRLEVTLADGSPPIDVDWPDEAEVLELMVPEIGHTVGDEFGPNEQWSVDLGTGPTTVAKSAVLASGSWLSWDGGGDGDGELDVLWANARRHGDTRFRPAATRGDYTFALELAGSGPCSRLPIGFGAFPPPPLGDTTADVAFWFTETVQLQSSWNVFPELADAGLALDDLADGGHVSQFTLGYAPLPQLVTPAWRIGPRMPTRMTGPGLLPLVECNADTMNQPFFTPINELADKYGETAYASIRFTRTVPLSPVDPSGPEADSGFEIVAPVSGVDDQPRAVVLARRVAFATKVQVGVDGAFLPLDADTVEINRTSNIGVKFIVEGQDPDDPGDDDLMRETNFFSITLARVEPTRLVPLRSFLTLGNEATFDLSDTSLYPAGGYVFVIRGHLGWSRASTGDFATYELPYQIATTTSFKFTLP